MRLFLVRIAAIAAATSGLACGGANQTGVSSQSTASTNFQKRPLPVPKPIPGGDIIPPLIHQFLPGPGFDGEWAEPNGMTDFAGTVAQVYMGGTATDQTGRAYLIEVDTRVYQGAFIDTAGELAHGTFCEI